MKRHAVYGTIHQRGVIRTLLGVFPAILAVAGPVQG
jgi:hypothetical protein